MVVLRMLLADVVLKNTQRIHALKEHVTPSVKMAFQ
jgi:hypothetical protein